MAHYVQFTKQQRTIARQTDIAAYLQSKGETLKRAGSEKEWKDGSEKVTIRGSVWFHQYERTGGDAVAFVQWYYKQHYGREIIYPEAVNILLEFNGYPTVQEQGKPNPVPNPVRQTPPAQHTGPVTNTPKEFKLPPRNATDKRAFAYLCSRGIAPRILSDFFKMGMIYESAVYHNAVFVGMDETGTPRHAHLRGATGRSQFKANATGSDPKFSFHYCGSDNSLYLFEAPIDMLSFISMHSNGWKKHSYAAACGVSDYVVQEMLEKHPNIDTVFLCLDNDIAGQNAAQRIGTPLMEKGFHVQVLCPEKKDWNEDLQEQIKSICAQQEEPVWTGLTL